MRKVWLDAYPPGVPPEIDLCAYASLAELLANSCARFGDRTAFSSMGVALTYGELDRLSRDFGAYLRHAAGIGKGERVVSGLKAWPTEIEDVIMLHPGVRDVGVAALPDERSGEAVAAYIVKRDAGLTAESVLEHCRQRLTGFKLPRHVEFRERLPKSPIGKILRRSLREDASETPVVQGCCPPRS